MNQTTPSTPLVFRVLAILLLVGLILACLMFFDTLLKPIAIGIVIWYLIRSMNLQISKIHIRKKKLPRWLRIIISIVVINAILFGTYQLMMVNVNALLKNYPVYEANLLQFLNNAGDVLNLPDLVSTLKSRIDVIDIPGLIRSIAGSVTAIIGDSLVILIYVIFLLLEESSFQNKIDIIFSNKNGKNVRQIIRQINKSTDRYLRLKTYVSFLTGTISYVILLIAGVDFAFLWAFLIFLLNFIPYIGSFVATLLPSIFAILQFGSFWAGFWVFVFVEIVQLVVGNYIEPKWMGKSLNLSPFVVVLALSIWGYIWGIFGMLLSVPIMSILLIVFAQFPSTRNFAILLTEKGDISEVIIPDESAHTKSDGT